MDQLVFVRGGGVDELVDDLIAGDAVAFRREIHDDAVAQHRLGEGSNVFERYVRPAINQRTGFRAEN